MDTPKGISKGKAMAAVPCCTSHSEVLSPMQINWINQDAPRISNEPEILKLYVRGFLLD